MQFTLLKFMLVGKHEGKTRGKGRPTVNRKSKYTWATSTVNPQAEY